MGPVAGKLLIVAALVALVSLDRLAAWVAMVIIAREFAVSTLRIAAGQQGAVIPASPLGKLKTIVQVVTVTALIAAGDADAAWLQALVHATVAVTVVSGVDYFLNVRRRIEEAHERARALVAAHRLDGIMLQGAQVTRRFGPGDAGTPREAMGWVYEMYRAAWP